MMNFHSELPLCDSKVLCVKFRGIHWQKMAEMQNNIHKLSCNDLKIGTVIPLSLTCFYGSPEWTNQMLALKSGLCFC